MILYHYTCLEHLSSILADGLNRGEAPLSDSEWANAVNLTTDPLPDGHGLDGGGRALTEVERLTHFRLDGVLPPEGAMWPDKKAARIALRISSTDRKLIAWDRWVAKMCRSGRTSREYIERLEGAAGGRAKAKTWWLYFGTISPDHFVSVVDTATGKAIAERVNS